MAIRIDPKVDFAFKLMLGSPEHPAVTIHFLNAILQPESLVTEVEILNPTHGKDRAEDKLVVLDILAQDAQGDYAQGRSAPSAAILQFTELRPADWRGSELYGSTAGY
jgi:hypothetical protein